MRSRRVFGRLEIQSQSRRAAHGKGAASEPQCTTKAGIQRFSLMCKIKNTKQMGKTAKCGVLEKMALKTAARLLIDQRNSLNHVAR